MRIGELADAVSVPAKTIRYYETIAVLERMQADLRQLGARASAGRRPVGTYCHLIERVVTGHSR